MSIVVGVRVRPFNKRELNLGSKLCIQMENKTTILTDDHNSKRQFTFDYSFWSHSQFKTVKGEYQPTGDKYTG